MLSLGGAAAVAEKEDLAAAGEGSGGFPRGAENPRFVFPQEFLQVNDEAWSIDDDVQAAVALRSCRNGVAYSHCRQESQPVKRRRVGYHLERVKADTPARRSGWPRRQRLDRG